MTPCLKILGSLANLEGQNFFFVIVSVSFNAVTGCTLQCTMVFFSDGRFLN